MDWPFASLPVVNSMTRLGAWYALFQPMIPTDCVHCTVAEGGQAKTNQPTLTVQLIAVIRLVANVFFALHCVQHSCHYIPVCLFEYIM